MRWLLAQQGPEGFPNWVGPETPDVAVGPGRGRPVGFDGDAPEAVVGDQPGGELGPDDVELLGPVG